MTCMIIIYSFSEFMHVLEKEEESASWPLLNLLPLPIIHSNKIMKPIWDIQVFYLPLAMTILNANMSSFGKWYQFGRCNSEFKWDQIRLCLYLWFTQSVNSKTFILTLALQLCGFIWAQGSTSLQIIPSPSKPGLQTQLKLYIKERRMNRSGKGKTVKDTFQHWTAASTEG